MKHPLLTAFLFFLFSNLCFSQETEFKEYSYSEFIKMIQSEKDTIFKLENAIIKFSSETDSSFIVEAPFLEPVKPLIKSSKIIIDKDLRLENVHFSTTEDRKTDSIGTGMALTYYQGVLHNIHFKETIWITNSLGFQLFNSEVEKNFTIDNSDLVSFKDEFLKRKNITNGIFLGNNSFHETVNISSFNKKDEQELFYQIFLNKFYLSNNNPEKLFPKRLRINITGGVVFFNKNELLGNTFSTIQLTNLEYIIVSENIYDGVRPVIAIEGTHQELLFNKNKFNKPVELTLSNLKPSDVLGWKQFNSNFYSISAFTSLTGLLPDEEYVKTQTDSFRSLYADKIRIQDAEAYAGESALKGIIYRHYRNNFDMVRANQVYMNLKDFETRRLEFLYRKEPSFDTFFQWKVNQFLKVFSNYGTKPSKAIVFSVYVVLIFALIYLFFPNSWDRHGKNRIINRYRFFTKYMNKNTSIQEVYLEDNKDRLLEYHEFKNYMESSKASIPKFFSVTALPLYRWAISGTKISAFFLKRIEIMKVSWRELPEHKRFWKSTILIGAFLVAIIYDLIIKILNALMLSINTFTTLGFGEIPIKGLPRYLAIIQGFIGWFMLTIFSVSLISQLLN